MSETERLAEFVAATGYEDLPAEDVARSKTCIRDALGVGLAATAIEAGDVVTDYVDVVAPGEDATVWGGGRASVEGAAFANGVLAHAMDWDDTTETHGFTHLTAQTLPAALAAAELAGASGRDLLAGYVVGAEVHYRVSLATYPSHYLHGWHYTGSVGTFGTAAAAASVLGLSAAEVERAFGIVASTSSSLRKQFGTMAKAAHAGHAAQMGVRAALLAREGFTAADAVFEGDIGWGEVMTPEEYQPAEMVEDLGEEWLAVEDVGFKPYPGGTLIHGAERAMHDLVVEHDLQPADVAEIRVTLDDVADDLLIHEEPADAHETLFSIEFPLAVQLLAREHGPEQFTDEFVTDPHTRAQMDKVVRDFGWSDAEAERFGDLAWSAARVVVETVDGVEHVAEEAYSSADHSEAFLAEKFRNCAATALDADAVDRVDRAVADLESPGALDDLLDALETG